MLKQQCLFYPNSAKFCLELSLLLADCQGGRTVYRCVVCATQMLFCCMHVQTQQWDGALVGSFFQLSIKIN